MFFKEVNQLQQKVILHSDLNNFYASVECLYNPELRGKPVAVAGDPEQRHGIVLAKNYQAKAYGIQTGDPLWMAKKKCKEIVFTPPHYDLYMRYSEIARDIYSDYTDQVEPFGLDECWLDVSGSTQLFGSGKQIADELRKRIQFELGITASVGVSYNKVFAKLGSDMRKPDATTVIDQQHFQQKVWPLPASDLLYVGKATERKLSNHFIHTIGDLARTNKDFLYRLLGKNGIMLWLFANGMDTSEVSCFDSKRMIKTIGNSTTAPRDLITDDDIKITLYVLSESVAERLRAVDFLCRTVQITIRDNQLKSYERQGRLLYPSCTAKELFQQAYALYQMHRPKNPMRSLGVRACNLMVQTTQQLSLFADTAKRQKQERLEESIDNLRRRFGHFSIQRGIMLTDTELSNLDPVNDHVIHPQAFLKGKL